VAETPFGAFLSERLDARGWSQRYFAMLAGINQAQLGRIIRGTRSPPLDAMASWATHLELSLAESQTLARLALAEHGADWIAACLIASSPGKRAAEPRQRYDRHPPA
jgi:transcriptional regulator with XRE-family HTH domain